MMAVGILGMGTFLPPIVRGNDWWPADAVMRWRDQMAHRATRTENIDASTLSPGTRLTLELMAEFAGDPFRGAIERRVMPDDMTSSQMEAAAARDALARAAVGPGDIDVILAQTPCPEYLMVNHACVAHRLLGLPQRCLALSTEAACNAFALHATLARALIASGTARHVLSVHSSAITRVHGPAEPHSAWWGDGAAAAVFGKVPDGKGLLAAVHQTDGSVCDALTLGVPGKQWWEDGEVTTHAVNRDSTRTMLLGMVDRGRGAIEAALRCADMEPAEVDFYASHQSTPWLTRATKAIAGLDRASTIVTFPHLGNMNSVNVPYILARADREGLLHDGSVVATFSGGLGETWSSLVMRWGR